MDIIVENGVLKKGVIKSIDKSGQVTCLKNSGFDRHRKDFCRWKALSKTAFSKKES